MKKFLLFLLGMAVGAMLVSTCDRMYSEQEISEEKVPDDVIDFVNTISSDVDFVIGYWNRNKEYDVNTAVGLWASDSVSSEIPSYVTISNFSINDYEQFKKLKDSQVFYYHEANSKEQFEKMKADYASTSSVIIYYDDEKAEITFSFIGEPPFFIMLNHDWGICLEGFVREKAGVIL